MISLIKINFNEIIMDMLKDIPTQIFFFFVLISVIWFIKNVTYRKISYLFMMCSSEGFLTHT